MKSLILILFTCCFFSLSAQAQLLCSDVYSKSYNLDSRPTPVIGLLVGFKNEKKMLLIGPYIGRGHASLLDVATGLGEVTTVLWGGEMLVSFQGSKYVIHRANETSGLVQELAYDRQKINDYHPYWSQIQAPYASNVAQLNYFLKHPRVIFSQNFRAENYDPKNEHLYPALNKTVGNNRHTLGNDVQMSASTTYILGMGGKLSPQLLKVARESLGRISIIVETFLETHRVNLNPEVEAQFIRLINDLTKLDEATPLTETFTPAKWAEINLTIDLIGTQILSRRERPYIEIFNYP